MSIIYKNLVIEGSSSKVFAFCGSLEVLENKGVLDTITTYIGTSSGSILCMLLNMGTTSKAILQILKSSDAKSITHTHIYKGVYNIYKKFGYLNEELYIEWIRSLIKVSGYSPDITFKELQSMTNKTLVITGTCLNKRETHYYHYMSNPDMPVWKAIRISTSIPFAFQPVEWKGDLLVDGAISENYPIYVVGDDGKPPNSRNCRIIYNPEIHTGNKETIGLKILAKDEQPDDALYHGNDKIDSFQKFVLSIMNMISTQLDRNNIRKGYWDNTVKININNDISILKLQLDKETINELYDTGKLCTLKFFDDKK